MNTKNTKKITFGFLTLFFLSNCAKKNEEKLNFEKVKFNETTITADQTHQVSKDLTDFILTVCIQGKDINKGYIDIHTLGAHGHDHRTTEIHTHEDNISGRRLIDFKESNCISAKYADIHLKEKEEYHVTIGASNKAGKSSAFYFEISVD